MTMVVDGRVGIMVSVSFGLFREDAQVHNKWRKKIRVYLQNGSESSEFVTVYLCVQRWMVAEWVGDNIVVYYQGLYFFLAVLVTQCCCQYGMGLAIHRSHDRVLSGHHCVVALGKLCTPVCLLDSMFMFL